MTLGTTLGWTALSVVATEGAGRLIAGRLLGGVGVDH